MNDRLAGLVPCPRSVRATAGSFPVTARTTVAAGSAAAGEGRQRAAADAAAAVRRVLSRLPWPDAGREPGASRDRATSRSTAQITVSIASDLGAEAYRLTITPDGIDIQAGGVPGAFYAAQTLRQLLSDDAWRAAAPNRAGSQAGSGSPSGPWHVPCAEIEDAPALSWRGAHLDVARHFFPKRELITLIDALAALKLNRLHLHLTDDQGWRMESRRYLALHEIGSHRPRTRVSLNTEQPPVYDETPHGGYYTLADLAEISAYAAERMITVVPEVEVPGHASALLAALPQLGAGSPPPGGYQVSADWGIFPYLMSPLPATIGFLRDIFGELLGAIRAPYVHIGGDECVLDSWRDDPAVDAFRRERGLAGPAELHAAFLREVADLLADDFGARAVVWDEGFASAGAAGAGAAGTGAAGTGAASTGGHSTGDQRRALREDTIVMAWRGMDIARRAAEAGHEVIASPVLPTYFDYYQSDDPAEPAGIGGPVRVEDVAAFSPAPADWPASARRRLIGTQFQVWSEYIRGSRDLEYMIFPRACALADVAWAGQAVSPPGAPLAGPARDRLAAHLRRLDAAGVDYRPLDGPRPWQQGGAGPRRHRQGYRMREVTAHLDELAAAAAGDLAAGT